MRELNAIYLLYIFRVSRQFQSLVSNKQSIKGTDKGRGRMKEGFLVQGWVVGLGFRSELDS